ncbi:LysR family transcriptional regulator [Heyndrickxia ginsengihumi]|uniref:LysR family transcriptional regulator n=1 Tax=Heyndrickxia ginsengihumi TaxID=363870 RepID=UPI00203BDEAD|nr:LysR family transcriptional regulator [Heyndrickxia ginsengihumi]MCM3024202.1 LysR family transcriptional regulator [Heyndrickxia ginsengihumi]
MEFRNLQTFHYAAQFLNYSKTAQHLSFSQPAVTKQIRLLEEELNVKLFIRIGNKMYLTPAGDALQKYTTKIFSVVEEMTNEMRRYEKDESLLKIGADISIITNNLQPVISQFYQYNQSVQMKIYTWEFLKVIDGIQSNEIDVGFISGDIKDPNILEYKISSDPIVLVISPVLAERYSLKQIMKNYPLICYKTKSPYAQLLDNYLVKNKLKIRGTIEFSNLEAVKSAVLQGVGISALTNDIVFQDLKNGKLQLVENDFEPMCIQTSMIYHKEKASSPLIQSLQEHVKEYWCNR